MLTCLVLSPQARGVELGLWLDFFPSSLSPLDPHHLKLYREVGSDHTEPLGGARHCHFFIEPIACPLTTFCPSLQTQRYSCSHLHLKDEKSLLRGLGDKEQSEEMPEFSSFGMLLFQRPASQGKKAGGELSGKIMGRLCKI